MESLRGKLLLASRRLADPNFFRTVILMIQHGDDGALGLVLNRPLEMTVKQACDDSLELTCQTEDVLHQGGPMQGPLMVLHSDRHIGLSQGGKLSHDEVFGGVYFTTDRDELEWLLKQEKPPAKFFVGYAGWGAGQLESELESGSWLITPATKQLVFHGGETEQWSKLVTLLTLGDRIKEEMIPDDPSVN
jgi:putative transcriptional regulator